MGGGGNRTTTSTQQVSQQINPKYDPYFQDLAKRAKAASNVVSNQPYGGNFVAQGTPAESQGINTIYNAANGVLPQLDVLAGVQQGAAANYIGAGSDVAKLGRDTINGVYTDPNNPILTGAINAAVNPLKDALSQNIQRLESTASAQGASGNSRVGELTARLNTDFVRNAGDVASGIVNNWYNRERGLQQNAPQLIAQGAALEGAPGQVASSSIAPTVSAGQLVGRSGELQRGLDTLGVQNQLAQFQEQQTAPYRPLFPYAQLLGSIPVTTQTNATGTTTAPSTGGPLGGVLQGGFGGAALAASLFPGTWWAPLAGAAAGGLTGGFGG